MKILLFSDLHNFDEEKLNKINIDPDLIIFLGDIKGRTLDQIIINFPNQFDNFVFNVYNKNKNLVLCANHDVNGGEYSCK